MSDKLGRFENESFFRALDTTRQSRRLNWREVATESGVSASTLTRMAQGKRPDVDSLAALVTWSGLNPSDYLVNPADPGSPWVRLQWIECVAKYPPRNLRSGCSIWRPSTASRRSPPP